MEQKQITTLWDAVQSGCHTLYDACRWFGRKLGQMVRLSWRKWWLVGTITLLIGAAALYYARPSNQRYKIQAIATLNGPTVQEVTTFYESLDLCYEAFHVIDCAHNGTPDFVDYKRKHSIYDTIDVVMPRQIALQFESKELDKIPQQEQQILQALNTNPVFVAAYQVYKAHADRQFRFDSEQVDKLDSMTSTLYASAGNEQAHVSGWNITNGKKEIVLPLAKIEEYLVKKTIRDHYYSQCTAPVVLQNHFTPCRKPINGRIKCTILGLLAGWLIGCLIAALIDDRQRIRRWLQQPAQE